MRCHGLALTGSNSRCNIPTPSTPMSIFSTRRGSTQILFPKQTRRVSCGIRAKATVDEVVAAEAMELSFYELLGVPESGSLVEIKQAYKQMARKYHPDVSPLDRIEEYTRKFIRVQEAYETLSDPMMRDLYDRDMAMGLHLVFSSRRRYNNSEEVVEKMGWKNRWEDQLSELKRRSRDKDSSSNMSWGSRMRRQMDELHNDT